MQRGTETRPTTIPPITIVYFYIYVADTADGSPTNDVSNDNSERLQCLILGLIASFHIVFNGIIGEETEIKCVLGVHAPETTIIPLL